MIHMNCQALNSQKKKKKKKKKSVVCCIYDWNYKG